MKTTTTAAEVFQLDIYAQTNGLDALTAEERAAVCALRDERIVRDARARFYVKHGCFPNGEKLYDARGNKI